MKSAGFDGLGPFLSDPGIVVFDELGFEVAGRRFLPQQTSGKIEIGQHVFMECAQLGQALIGKIQAALDLLVRQLHQVVVDDVADMLEIRREAQNFDVAGAFLGVKFRLTELGEIELDGFVPAVPAINPWPANEATIKAVAVLLCTATVTPRPAAKAINRLRADNDNALRNSAP